VVGYHPFQKEGASEQHIMASIRTPKLSIPDYVEKPLAAIITKALTPDLRNRYRSAGDFAGPLFGYALDTNMLPSKREMQVWLESMLGLLV
jgi:eukaryotic-like serine/threonine-protein kinase